MKLLARLETLNPDFGSKTKAPGKFDLANSLLQRILDHLTVWTYISAADGITDRTTNLAPGRPDNDALRLQWLLRDLNKMLYFRKHSTEIMEHITFNK